MSSEKSEDISYIDTIPSQIDQGTQTIKLEEVDVISVSTSHKLPIPRDLEPIETGTVTVYELNNTPQDTETPQSTTSTETEENITHPTKKYSNIEALSNRYQYCKDVIAPYLGHAEQSLTASQVLKDAVDDSKEDYSYLNPCLQGFDAREGSQITFCSNQINLGVDERTSTNNMSDDTEEANTSKPPCPEKEQPEEEIQSEPQETQTTSKPKKKPTNKLCKEEKELKICFKHFETGQRRNVCPPKEEKKCNPKSEFTKQEVTVPYVNLVVSNPLQQPSIEKIIDNHIQTVSSIKLAMDDFMDKVCESSKEAIAMIACESVKQLEKLKKTDAAVKCCDHNCRANTIQLLQDVQSAKEMNLNMRDDFSQALDNFMTTVDSTLSGINNAVSQNDETIPETLKTPTAPNITDKLNVHREYPCAHMFTPDEGTTQAYPTNVFSTIKSKIFSIFSEDRTPPAITMVDQSHQASGKHSLVTPSATGTVNITNEKRESGNTTH